MEAQILTLNPNSSTELICKSIATEVNNFKGRVFVEKVDEPIDSFYGYCAVIANKPLKEDEAKKVFKSLELVRQFELDKNFMEDYGIDTIESVVYDIETAIRKNDIRKLPKLSSLLEDLILQYS